MAVGLAGVARKPILQSCMLGSAPVVHPDIENSVAVAVARINALHERIGEFLSNGDPQDYDALARIAHHLDEAVAFTGFLIPEDD